MKMYRRGRRLAVVLTVLALGACQDDPAEPVSSPPASVVLEASTLNLSSMGETVALTARVLDAGGATLVGYAVRWESSRPDVLRHEGGGTFRVVGNGPTSLTARVEGSAAPGGVEGSLQIDVRQQAVSIQREDDGAPVLALWALGQTLALPWRAVDASGAPIPQHLLDWSSDDPSVVGVHGDGTLTAYGSGTATVRVRAGALSQSIVVEVDSRVDFEACADFTGGPAGQQRVCVPFGLDVTQWGHGG